MFMSVSGVWMNATQMQLATTRLEVMTAFATSDSLEMDSYAQVYTSIQT